VAERKDDQNPAGTGAGGGKSSGPARNTCGECGTPLAADQRYCVNCGARRGLLPGAVAGTVASLSSKGKAAAAAAAGKAGVGKGGAGAGGGGKGAGGGDAGKGGDGGGGGGWSWMPSPPAIAIAVIGMLALGVGLGSAMSEIASSAPLTTILLEYPHHAVEGKPPAEEPEEEEFGGEEETESTPEVAEVPAEPLPLEVPTEPLPEELPTEPLPEEATEEGPSPLQESIEQVEREQEELEEQEASGGEEEALPEVKHAFVIVLGEGGYDETWGVAAGTPYMSRVLPKKGELLPNYYGVTGGVLANEIALLSGQGPTAETAANCPNYTAIAPGTVNVFAEQVEGAGCVYGKEVKSLPSQLSEKEISWRAYVQDMENGGGSGQPWRCRKPNLGEGDGTFPVPGDQYANWRNPVIYFSAIVESEECEKHDVGFELLPKDLSAKKKTPTLSLIFPNACHSGGEYECEPGAPKGAKGVAQELKSLVPAIMASPAYEEGGLIAITSAQAPQTGEHADQKSCCLAPEYPNLPLVAGATPAPKPTTGTSTTPGSTTTPSTTATSEEATSLEPTPTKYTEESVKETGGGGKVGLLLISPFVEAGKVEETEYANHFTLLKTLAEMLGVEPTGYATEEEVPALSGELFIEPTETTAAGEAAGTTEATETSGAATQSRRSRVGPQGPVAPRPGTF
jgi:phosphatidylinositol-3-phosphatase